MEHSKQLGVRKEGGREQMVKLVSRLLHNLQVSHCKFPTHSPTNLIVLAALTPNFPNKFPKFDSSNPKFFPPKLLKCHSTRATSAPEKCSASTQGSCRRVVLEHRSTKTAGYENNTPGPLSIVAIVHSNLSNWSHFRSTSF